MDTVKAIEKRLAAEDTNAPLMVFDWDKAAQLIRERKPNVAGAGLRHDWEYTGGDIYRNGEPVPPGETYVYLASIWAVPELDMDGVKVPCYREYDEELGWNESTYWPQSALKLLGLGGEDDQ